MKFEEDKEFVVTLTKQEVTLVVDTMEENPDAFELQPRIPRRVDHHSALRSVIVQKLEKAEPKGTKKFLVTARDAWTSELQAAFGKSDQIHDLTAEEVIEAIEKHGRATIKKISSSGSEDNIREICFENGYD